MNNKTNYRVIKELCEDRELGIYSTYGIVAQCGEQKECIHDVTTDYAFASALVDTFNRNELSIIHFSEVLEDMLC